MGAAVATKQVKSAGKVTIPGLCMIKTRVKPATKAGKREIFGKMVVVKAKPAKTVVKSFPVAALKKIFKRNGPLSLELGMLAEWRGRYQYGMFSELAAPAESLCRRRGDHHGAACSKWQLLRPARQK